MKLTDEADSVLVASGVQGLILNDDVLQLNNKYAEGLCLVLYRPGRTPRGEPNPRVSISVIS